MRHIYLILQSSYGMLLIDFDSNNSRLKNNANGILHGIELTSVSLSDEESLSDLTGISLAFLLASSFSSFDT